MFQFHCNLVEPLSDMKSIIDQNVIMWHMTVCPMVSELCFFMKQTLTFFKQVFRKDPPFRKNSKGKNEKDLAK